MKWPGIRWRMPRKPGKTARAVWPAPAADDGSARSISLARVSGFFRFEKFTARRGDDGAPRANDPGNIGPHRSRAARFLENGGSAHWQ